MAELKSRVQVSAGGVAFRKEDNQVYIALISVADNKRWQLPKGRVANAETPEAAALREVREEAGINTEYLGPIDEIEYWFFAGKPGRRVRIHKFVRFYLLRFLSGDPRDHDKEVDEARWVDIDQAQNLLAFESEKDIVRQAKDLIDNLEA